MLDATTASPPELLVHHLVGLERWCRRHSRDRHLAEDVLQETALAAWARLDRLKDAGSMRGWLFRIARRRFADAARRRRAVSLRAEPVAPEQTEGASGRTSAERQVLVALRRLPIELRRPVRLHYLLGRSIREVAEHLGSTPDAIKARLYRARRRLREEEAR